MTTRSDRLFDRALQLERTHLSWSRTALAFLGDGALVGRMSHRVHPGWLALAVAGVMAALGVWSYWHGRDTYPARSAALKRGRSPAQPAVLRALAAATTVVAVAAAALAISTLG